MSRDKKDLHAELVTAYDQACDEYKKLYPTFPQPFVTCTYRSAEEQNSLYEIGRSLPGKIVTMAKAGQSPHNFTPSLAFDIGFIGLDKKLSWDKKYFKFFADCIKTDTVEWGGSWANMPDAPHFQLKAWNNLKPK